MFLSSISMIHSVWLVVAGLKFDDKRTIEQSLAYNRRQSFYRQNMMIDISLIITYLCSVTLSCHISDKPFNFQTNSTSRYSGTINIRDTAMMGKKYLRKWSCRFFLLSISWWCTSGYRMAMHLSCDIPTVKNMDALKEALYSNLTNLDNTIEIFPCARL